MKSRLSKGAVCASICLAACLAVMGCGTSSSASSAADASQAGQSSSTSDLSTNAQSDDAQVGSDDAKTQGIDYLALVNKNHPLPAGWEDSLKTVRMTNSVGDDVEVEKKSYDAYLKLKAALEKEGVYVDLDSARRSVEQQQKIMDDFTKKYGADYAKKTVATPGYSEHQTGLALDLYLIIDGKDVTKNEDMITYPEVWEKIHARLADYGFILRYLKGDEHITGYGYEPWHIRYVDDPAIAKEIADKGITFEEYKAGKVQPEVSYDFGKSDLYTTEELEEAAIQAKCEFATFEGCELHSLRYAGDKCNTKENLDWLNSLDEEANYTQVVELLTDFHSPVEGGGAWEADTEMKDYQWWLAREEGKGWQLVTFGY
ncbi:MAG: M15 family metallopeptidase [Atopobiaceae bacterium]|nr:M15 family metallopeptidase [Atopobiaceae bacterium]